MHALQRTSQRLPCSSGVHVACTVTLPLGYPWVLPALWPRGWVPPLTQELEEGHAASSSQQAAAAAAALGEARAAYMQLRGSFMHLHAALRPERLAAVFGPSAGAAAAGCDHEEAATHSSAEHAALGERLAQGPWVEPADAAAVVQRLEAAVEQVGRVDIAWVGSVSRAHQRRCAGHGVARLHGSFYAGPLPTG